MQKITSRRVALSAIVLAAVYVVVTIYLMNYRLVVSTLAGDYGFSTKISILASLLGGMWTAMNPQGLIVLFLTAILTGVNLSLIAMRLISLTKLGSLHIMAGGSSVLGLVTSGCAGCGLPILALLGLSGSLIYLPLRGLELAYLSIILLLLSLYFLIKSSGQEADCKIVRK